MADLVVTCPRDFWLEWIAEGDAAGDPPTGEEWGWFMNGRRPPIGPGDRLYVVAHGLLRGYAPVTRLHWTGNSGCICRRGDAVAVTIDQTIKGFQSWRYRWWQPGDEKPFPDWRTAGVAKTRGAR